MTTDDFDEQHIRERGETDPRASRLVLVGLLVFWALVAWVLSGCQTIREHPRLAAGAAAVVVTSIALSTNHRDYQPAPDIRLPIPPTRELAR